MNEKIRRDLLHLSVPEKIKLIDDLWDSLEDVETPLSDELKAELDVCIKEHEANPREGISWAKLKASLRPARKKRS